jgi:hypothetical protein
MLGNGRTLLAIPISTTRVYVYADLAVSTDNVQSFSQSSPLGPLFKDFAGPVFPLIESLAPDTYIHYSSLQEVRLKDWVKGRAVLLGERAWQWKMPLCLQRSCLVKVASGRLFVRM